jgi:quercetin dioxygenase-like cupin family protein
MTLIEDPARSCADAPVLSQPLVRTGGRPGLIRHIGVTVNNLVRAADTGGAWSLLEYTMPPGFDGPPLHWHAAVTEVFYCVAGEIAFTLDGREVRTKAGDVVVVPPRIVHTLRNGSHAPAVFIALLMPGGFERYFDEIAELAERSEQWPPNPEELAAIVGRSDQRFDLPLG